MKAYNRLLVFGVIMLLCNVAFAQKSNWTLGFRLGCKGDVLEKTILPDFKIKTKSIPTSITTGLDITYNINQNFSIAGGIGFLEYSAVWGIEESGKKWMWDCPGTMFFRYLQIPLNIKYAVPLWRSNFSVYGKLGFSFDILVYKNNESPKENRLIFPKEYFIPPYIHEYEHTAKIHDKGINFLVNAGVGISYRFRNGFGLFVEGEYHAGLRTIGHVFIDIKKVTNGTMYEVLNEYKELLLIKGSCWNVNLGISYTFKKKENKKKNEEIQPKHWEI